MGDACDDSSGIIFCGTIVLVSDGAPHPFDRRKTIARRATIEVEFIGRNVFCVTGLLNPNSFELKFCVAIFFWCIPKPWDCSSGSDFIFLQNQFLGGIELLK